MASFAEIDKDVVPKTGEDSEQMPAANIDVTTVAYMFDIANRVPEDESFKKCVLERAENFHIGHLRPHVVFSIRYGTREDDNAAESRLWAQRHVLAKEAYYVISSSPYDLEKGRDERSQHFLGKLKKSHNSRVFTGWSYLPEGRKPLCAVIYEHERNQSDRKMEVGLPVSDEDNLMQHFNNCRYEGAQNHSSFKNVRFFHQRLDDPAIMASTESLETFALDGVQLATVPSSKNFQLVCSTAFRQQFREGQVSSDEVILQMGKLEDHLFSVAYRSPFTLLQAFMIALSRFETQQKY